MKTNGIDTVCTWRSSTSNSHNEQQPPPVIVSLHCVNTHCGTFWTHILTKRLSEFWSATLWRYTCEHTFILDASCLLNQVYHTLFVIMLAVVRTTRFTLGKVSGSVLPGSMRAYHDNIIDHYENPRNVGSLDKNKKTVGTGIYYHDIVVLRRMSWCGEVCRFGWSPSLWWRDEASVRDGRQWCHHWRQVQDIWMWKCNR